MNEQFQVFNINDWSLQIISHKWRKLMGDNSEWHFCIACNSFSSGLCFQGCMHSKQHRTIIMVSPSREECTFSARLLQKARISSTQSVSTVTKIHFIYLLFCRIHLCLPPNHPHGNCPGGKVKQRNMTLMHCALRIPSSTKPSARLSYQLANGLKISDLWKFLTTTSHCVPLADLITTLGFTKGIEHEYDKVSGSNHQFRGTTGDRGTS